MYKIEPVKLKKLLELCVTVLLFSILGVFSYLLLMHYTELAERTPDKVSTFGAVMTIVFVFNIFGFSLLKINDWLAKNSPMFYAKRSRLIWRYFIIALLLLLLNYAIFIIIKWLGEAPSPFIIRTSGMRLMLLVWLVEMIIVSLILINHSTVSTLKLYKEKQQLQEEATRAQYMALQNQLNPHFLFNSLNTLIAEIEYDPENASKFTRNLSDVYRYILQQQDKLTVSLHEEMGFLDSYIFLHQVRLGNCMNIDNRLPSEILNYKVPPLTLQLLAENVIKHNYMNEKTPVTISLFVNEERTMLFVSNDLHPKKGVAQSGKGLKNLSERYRLLCNKTIDIQTKDNNFTVSIPLIYE